MEITVTIDDRPYRIPDEGRNLLDVCLSLGFDVPYFCWHPAMQSVGACRQCAVKLFKDDRDTTGRIVMSCMTLVADGMRVRIDDPDAVAFRARVIEWLMVNHPHDCPICDEGGECHLQDMTVMTGHNYRRFRFRKRTHRNQDLGPFVNHEMNRCIQCYRCVRFYNDYAGGRDFGVFGWHDGVYFGRHEAGTLQSEFAGNLVEICPTGVFTDKTLQRHYTRKWDLQTAPSICVHCGLGCNTIPGERYGMLRRIYARFNAEVNGYFLCDRGRFGYEFVNDPSRVRAPRVRRDGRLETADREAALERAGAILRSGTAIGIGSPRASLESNFALRCLVGEGNFHHGLSAGRFELLAAVANILRSGPAASASLRDVGDSDAVLVLGEDVAATAPMAHLALRQAVRNQPIRQAEGLHIPRWDDAAIRQAVQDARGPLFVATTDRTALDPLATQTYRAAPDDLARLGLAVAHAIDPAAPAADGLDAPARELAGRIAEALRQARRPLVVSGAGCGSLAVIQAAANVAWALARTGHDATRLCYALPECNSMGLALMGGVDLETAVDRVQSGLADTVIVLENDLYRRLDARQADAILSAPHVIVIDSLETATARRAEIVLPAATFAEADGTLVNSEGRAQRSFQVFVPDGPIQASWRWAADLARAIEQPSAAEWAAHAERHEEADVVPGQPSTDDSGAPTLVPPSSRVVCGLGVRSGKPTEAAERAFAAHLAATPELHAPAAWRSLDDVLAALAAAMDVFAAVPGAAPPANFRVQGMRIPRQSHRYSGRTAMTANLSVHEPKPPADMDAPMSFSMEGYEGAPPPALIPRFWAPGWNSVQAINKFQIEVGGPLHGGPCGTRLIEPAEGTAEQEEGQATEKGLPPYFAHVPPPAARREGWWLVVPAWHVFGSDELSVRSPGIAQLSPGAYVAVGREDAQRLGLRDGQEVTLELGGTSRRLALKISPGLPTGLAALPAGLTDLPTTPLPQWGTIAPT